MANCHARRLRCTLPSVQPFALFDPALIGRGGTRPPHGLVVREARVEDALELGRILAERKGTDAAPLAESFAAEIASHDPASSHLLLVARLEERAVGFGRVTEFVPPRPAPPRCAPGGLYLSGVVVAREARARGVGSALVRARLAWCAERADCVHAVSNARNTVSLHLLARNGFRELTRDIVHPGVEFTGGIGVLLARRLDP